MKSKRNCKGRMSIPKKTVTQRIATTAPAVAQLCAASAIEGWLKYQEVAQPPGTVGGKGALKVELNFWVSIPKN